MALLHSALLVLILAVQETEDGFIGPPPPPGLADEEDARLGELTDEERARLAFGTGFDERFSAHRLNYAILGNDDLKMQLSFKYRIVSDAAVYVAFTNVIAWDVYEPSFPYRDINFNPEIFYRLAVDAERGIHLDLGYWHNSNGEEGPDSRSWDRLVARGLIPGSLLGREFVVAPALYHTLDTESRNDDIEDFLGNWELGFLWHNLLSPDEEGDDIDLILEVIGGKGTLQLGAQYRLDSYKWNPHLFAQLFSGYGDTLIEYDERKTELRFGLSFYE